MERQAARDGADGADAVFECVHGVLGITYMFVFHGGVQGYPWYFVLETSEFAVSESRCYRELVGVVKPIDQFKTTDWLGFGTAWHGFCCEEPDVPASCKEER